MQAKGILATMLAGTVLLWAGVARAGPTDAATCESAKNKEAGKYAACRAKAEAKLAKTEGTCSVTTDTLCYRDTDCLSGTCDKPSEKYAAAILKCQTKFWGKWSDIETKYGPECPTSSDRDDIDGLVTDRVDRVAWELSNTNRYWDNGDGTITDRKLGLMWEKKVGLGDAGTNLGLHDADHGFLWANRCSLDAEKYCQPTPQASAACTAGVEGDASGCVQCTGAEGTCDNDPGTTIWEWLVALNTEGLAGHNDWRIAKREELVSMVDYTGTTDPPVEDAFRGVSCGPGCTDMNDAACSCTRSAAYWSSSTFAPPTDYAWYVGIGPGQVYWTIKGSTTSVRAVRGGL